MADDPSQAQLERFLIEESPLRGMGVKWYHLSGVKTREEAEAMLEHLAKLLKEKRMQAEAAQARDYPIPPPIIDITAKTRLEAGEEITNTITRYTGCPWALWHTRYFEAERAEYAAQHGTDRTSSSWLWELTDYLCDPELFEWVCKPEDIVWTDSQEKFFRKFPARYFGNIFAVSIYNPERLIEIPMPPLPGDIKAYRRNGSYPIMIARVDMRDYDPIREKAFAEAEISLSNLVPHLKTNVASPKL